MILLHFSDILCQKGTGSDDFHRNFVEFQRYPTSLADHSVQLRVLIITIFQARQSTDRAGPSNQLHVN